ncbi:MAG: hypothetical protein ACREPT_01540 [Rudaea sp.]
MHAKLLMIAALMFGCSGCATERYATPKITSAPRTGLQLKNPVMASVYDGRTNGADLKAAASLQTELTNIYGGNFQWVSYFDPVPKGRVALRIRIVMLGSSFDSRLISSANFETAVQSARVSLTGPWGGVFGTATGSSTIFGGSFTGEGWWNGAAWIDVEIQDNRSGTPSRFTIPIASEDKESNMWGYSSGDKAASKAWETASAQLTRTIDEVLRTVRDSEG